MPNRAGDDGRKASGHGEAQPGRDHQKGGKNQERARIDPSAQHPGAERHERRAEQRDGRHHADLGCPEAKHQEVGRQQHGHEAVAEIAQPPRQQDAAHRLPVRQAGGRRVGTFAGVAG